MGDDVKRYVHAAGGMVQDHPRYPGGMPRYVRETALESRDAKIRELEAESERRPYFVGQNASCAERLNTSRVSKTNSRSAPKRPRIASSRWQPATKR